MAELQPSKLIVRVRFPSPAPREKVLVQQGGVSAHTACTPPSAGLPLNLEEQREPSVSWSSARSTAHPPHRVHVTWEGVGTYYAGVAKLVDVTLELLAEIDEQPSGHAQGISAYTADGRHLLRTRTIRPAT
jgi:hypothetical protein